MRSFARSVLCVMPSVLFACGTTAPSSNDDMADDMATDTHESDPGHDTPRAIRATLDIGSPSCDSATAGFEVLASHVDDSTFVKNARCHITFDDGATSDLCLGEHIFASGGAHTFKLEVEDLDTGAKASAEVTRNIAVPLEVELALDVPACGLELGFKATLSTGALVNVTLSPPEKVVAPHVFGLTGRFEVREPGTYTIRVSAEDERATGPICVRELSREVTLTACHPDC